MIEIGHFPFGAALSDSFPLIVAVVTAQAEVGVDRFTDPLLIV